MLDLEPGVDLEEVERPVRGSEELGRGGVPQPGRGRDLDRHGVQVAPFRGGQAGCRRLLDQLLVTTLERAVALADGHDLAGHVAQQLDLDVARRDDLALEIDRAVPERRGGFARPAGQCRRQFRSARYPAHAPAAAAGGGLDQQREADPLGLRDDRCDLVGPVHGRRLQGPGHRVDPDRPRGPTGMELVAQGVDRIRRRTDEDETGLLHGSGERCPLGQEAVARVDGLRAGRPGRLDDGVDAQVGLGRRRRADPDGDVGETDVPGVGVRVAVDRHGLHAELVAGPDDPDRDLTAVGDEDAAERRGLPLGGVFAQRRSGHRGIRVGCCHASSGDWCRACRPGPRGRG